MDHALEQEITTRLQAMTSLEKAQGYLSPNDYLSPHYIHPPLQRSDLHYELLNSFPNNHGNDDAGVITQEYRAEMILWFHEFVDLCHCDMDCVVYAVSFMDRYLSLYKCSVDMLRLVGTISVFLAVKVHGGQCVRFPLKFLVELWKGYFSMEDFETMERSILQTFNYRMHPLCAHDFMKECLRVLKTMVPTTKKWTHIQKMSSRLCQDTSLFNYVFVGKNASSVGLACILAVLDGFSQDSFSVEHRQQFLNVIFVMANFSDDAMKEVAFCHSLLWDIYSKTLHHHETWATSPSSPDAIMTTRVSNTGSPLSVSQVPSENHDSGIQLFIADDCDNVEAVRVFG